MIEKLNFKNYAFVALTSCLLLSSLNTKADELNQPTLRQKTDTIAIYEARDMYVVQILDPYADFNKVISDFNANAYQYIEKPASFYKRSPYMAPIRWTLTGVYNIASNFSELTLGTTSNIITGHFTDAGLNVSRSVINMIALGGAYDIATTLSEKRITDPDARKRMSSVDSLTNALRSDVKALAKPKIENFNDAFQEWGFGCGVYLVLPLIGPGTAREFTGKVTQIPLEPDTYIQPLMFVRLAANLHKSLSDADRASAFLKEYNLSTPEGKEQYYNLLRTAILSSNQCINDDAVKANAEKQGLNVTNEDF